MVSKGIVVRGFKNVSVEENTVKNVDVGIEVEGEHVDVRGNEVSCDVDAIVAKLPILRSADKNLILEAITAASKDTGSFDNEKLRKTALGQWLEKQSFVEWATLAATIVGVLPK